MPTKQEIKKQKNREYYLKNKKRINARNKQYRLDHSEHLREYGRNWIRDKWKNDPDYRSKHIEVVKKYRAKNKIKVLFWNNTVKRKFKRSANSKLMQAVKMKHINRPNKCERCNKKCKPEGHHHKGYQDPLNVIWLCTSCHGEIHRI